MLTGEQYTQIDQLHQQQWGEAILRDQLELLNALKDDGHSIQQLEKLTGLKRNLLGGKETAEQIKELQRVHSLLVQAVAMKEAVRVLRGHDAGWWEVSVVPAVYYFTPWDALSDGNLLLTYALAYTDTDEERKQIVQNVFPEANLEDDSEWEVFEAEDGFLSIRQK